MRVSVVRVIAAAVRVRVPMATAALGSTAPMLTRQRRRRALSRAAAFPYAIVYTL